MCVLTSKIIFFILFYRFEKKENRKKCFYIAKIDITTLDDFVSLECKFGFIAIKGGQRNTFRFSLNARFSIVITYKNSLVISKVRWNIYKGKKSGKSVERVVQVSQGQIF